MISAGSKRILDFDNDSLMWCHLALEMKNVKLALIIFHLFSKQIFMQDRNVNHVWSKGLGQCRGLKQLRAASMQWCDLWVSKELENQLLAPKAYFIPSWATRRNTRLQFSFRARKSFEVYSGAATELDL